MQDVENEPQRLRVAGYEFTYYPRSGGIVISEGTRVVDAGLIGARGVATREQLDRYAKGWVAWRRDYYAQVRIIYWRRIRRGNDN